MFYSVNDLIGLTLFIGATCAVVAYTLQAVAM